MMKIIFLIIPVVSAIRFNRPTSDFSDRFGVAQAELLPKTGASSDTGGSDIVYQKPNGEIKGIFLYLHGCGGYMTDMFKEYGPDGHHLAICRNISKALINNGPEGQVANMKFGGCNQNNPETIQMRQKARARGYLVAATQGTTGEGKCTRVGESERIAKAVKWLQARENLMNVPIIVAGMSAGGGAAPTVSLNVQGSCTIMVASASHPQGKLENAAGFDDRWWQSPTPVMFIHHPQGSAGERTDIETNLKQLQDKSVNTAEIIINPDKVPQPHINHLGAHVDEAIDFCETGKKPKEWIEGDAISFLQLE
jgi:hypothetical protein